MHVTEDNLHVRDSGKLLALDQLLARIRIEVCYLVWVGVGVGVDVDVDVGVGVGEWMCV